MVATQGKVIFAEDAATVHIKDGDELILENGQKYQPIFSKVLTPGETLSLNQVPSYVLNDIKEGKAPGLALLTPAQVRTLHATKNQKMDELLRVAEADDTDKLED